METSFRSYDLPLTNVESFKCLGRIITSTYNYSLVVVANLSKYRNNWACMSSILSK